MDPPYRLRTIGICDKCGDSISIDFEESFLILRARNVKWDVETYQVEYRLCEKCKKEFEKWIFK